MPIFKTLEHLPAGVSLTAALSGEPVDISAKAYFSSEDGNTFFIHLEAVWSNLGGAIAIMPSQVDHFLALIDRNREATLYCNELQQIVSMRPKGSIQAGQMVVKDDIATIEELAFIDNAGNKVEIPQDSGIVLIHSVGWRKCLYYDFEILRPGSPPREIDAPKLFGRFHQQLLFQEIYRITDDQWSGMLKWSWFPFIWMSEDDRRKVISFSTRPQEPRSLFEEICGRFTPLLSEKVASWKQHNLFKTHSVFIEKAAEHYAKDDFISAIHCLFPQIEGIMRTLHLLQRPAEKAGQKTMVEALVERQVEYSLLLPSRFREYITQFYFRNFDQAAGDVPLSRNTIAHGVSLPEDYDFIIASLGFMILDQMFYFVVGT